MKAEALDPRHGRDAPIGPRPINPSLRDEERARSVRQWLRDWEATFEALRDGLVVLDASGRAVRVNRSFRLFFHLDGRKVAGLELEELLQACAGDQGRRAAVDALASVGSAVEFRYRRRSYELSVDQVESARDVGVGYLAVISDITGKRALEEQRKRLRRRTAEARALRSEADRLASLEKMKTRVLNLVSHELRTPVTVIGGYLDLLSNADLGPLPEAAREVLPLISEQVHRMNGLIAEILDVARIDEGGLGLDRVRVDLGDLAETALAGVLDPGREERRVILTRPTGVVPVLADAERVRGVIAELIENALKYSSELVNVRVVASGESAYVYVSDSGFGIEQEDQESIFLRLGRVITSENANIPGSGLGLYIAREIARSHGGDIAVDSRPGAGSTFILHLPLAPTALRSKCSRRDGRPSAEPKAHPPVSPSA